MEAISTMPDIACPPNNRGDVGCRNISINDAAAKAGPITPTASHIASDGLPFDVLPPGALLLDALPLGALLFDTLLSVVPAPVEAAPVR